MTPNPNRIPSRDNLSVGQRLQAFIQGHRLQILAVTLVGSALVLAAAVLLDANGSELAPAPVLTTGTPGVVGPAVASGDAPADAELVAAVTQVSSAVFDAVGVGGASDPPSAIMADAPLRLDGKPEVLYVGGEFCPFCAAERWAMILALSRFGSFSNLQTTRSSAIDVYPSTPTFSFYGSSYQSDYVSFVPVEHYSNQIAGSSYAVLQPLTSDQAAIFMEYDSDGSIPFIDFGNQYLLLSASYDPGVLAGRDWQTIASSLSNTNSALAQAIVGTANVLAATICQITAGQPADVCASDGVTKASRLLQ